MREKETEKRTRCPILIEMFLIRLLGLKGLNVALKDLAVIRRNDIEEIGGRRGEGKGEREREEREKENERQ